MFVHQNQRWGQINRRQAKKLKLKNFEKIKGRFRGWLQYYQFHEVFRQDKKKGFATEFSRFEKEVIYNEVKTLSRMYKILLDWSVKEEEVKSVMVKWAMDIGHNIQLSAWKKLWKEDLKFTACYTLKKNYMEIFNAGM